jgi:hypothetical protein
MLSLAAQMIQSYRSNMKKTLLKPGMLAGLLLGLVAFSSCYYDNEEDLYGGGCDTSAVKFSTFIQPLLSSQCYSCHSGAAPTGIFDLSSYDNVKTMALDNNRLYAAVTRTTNWMPNGGAKLDNCTLSKIDAWVKAGAPNN